MPKGTLVRGICELLDTAARVLGRRPSAAAHIATGHRGEDAAHFHLRGLGYTIVARNWRSPRRRGEIDLVAWEGKTLCFVEVKTRSSREVKPAEAAVDRAKRRETMVMAREYLRRRPLAAAVRFDVVSVYFAAGQQPVCEVFQNAYGWRTMPSRG